MDSNAQPHQCQTVTLPLPYNINMQNHPLIALDIRQLDRLSTTCNITCLRIVAEALEENIGCRDRPVFVLATVHRCT